SKGHFSVPKKRAFFPPKNPRFFVLKPQLVSIFASQKRLRRRISFRYISLFLLRKNGFAAGFLSGTHCGFTLILRFFTPTCHQYHQFHM
ncbi:hypothetical protein, partial [Anaerotignum lactatifermentans]|uniref:hypothetical protein n=1 Tax=Anaerotignum lactatifermentans TaxID=160404 RepID=UPI001961E75A